MRIRKSETNISRQERATHLVHSWSKKAGRLETRSIVSRAYGTTVPSRRRRHSRCTPVPPDDKRPHRPDRDRSGKHESRSWPRRRRTRRHGDHEPSRRCTLRYASTCGRPESRRAAYRGMEAGAGVRPCVSWPCGRGVGIYSGGWARSSRRPPRVPLATCPVSL